MKYLVIFAFILAGCAAMSEKKYYLYSSRQSESVAAKEEFSRIYELSKIPDYELEKKFTSILEEASSKVFSSASSYYSYSMSPYGAVYPFSRVKVACLFTGSARENDAKKTCFDFFQEIELGLRLAR